VTRATGPATSTGGDLGVPLAVLAACWAPVGAVAAVWAAGRAASWAAGHGWVGPALDLGYAVALARGGPAAVWPTVPAWATVAVLTAAGLVFAGVVAAVVGWRSRARADPAHRALAGPGDVAALAPAGVTRRAKDLRPSLRGRRVRAIPAAECGVALGRLGRARGPVLRASWEDVLLAVMAPRSGKTTALAVPALLEAPGAVVATSNKADLYAATTTLRAAATGERVWVFDPQAIAHVPQTWWWDPLRGITTVEDAHRLAGHFVQEVRGHRTKDFWTSAAHDLLTSLVLAAALSGQSLVEVYDWLNDPTLSTPADLLRVHGRAAAAASLTGRQHGAPETRDGVYETARTAAQCLRDDRILTWVTPPTGPLAATAGEELHTAAFATTKQTLYLLSRDGAGAAAPLVAALTDRVMADASRAAERAGGRLDPPMLVVLDEAANVCRIADLPDLYSHLGSRGIVPLTILQSYRQGTRVWGEQGMDALWSAATAKVIGSGIDDAKVAEDISRLVGDHDVPVRSTTRGPGQTTTSTTLRRQRILPPDAVRALPRGTAPLLATGTRAALAHLTPWYAGPHATAITDALAETQAALTGRVNHRPDAGTAPDEPHDGTKAP
jgi:type IV secretory pathway TraG/TraD family ATPase VirD4